ncbi:angiopoietin-related protein 4 [Esox lucius]|uniref:Fibrinogen C-terminal domain-containing protein n=1 Tax=Esox lucius TaxID=8010 RepID=A0AAY5JYC1_ESOLU|nr:angiopoietin-related protein 4 [Esox lucius]
MKVQRWFLNIEKTKDSSQDKKMKPTLAFLLLLGTVLFHVGTSFTFGGDRAQYVTWDEMNLIAHGLLQLGQGLREHAEKAKSQMSDVSAKLNAFNNTITNLVRRIGNLQKGEDALKTRTQEMVERENWVVNMSAEVQARTQELIAEHQRIHSRMDQLEERVNGMLQGREERVNGMLQGREERVNGMLKGREERGNGMLQGREMERVNGMLQGREERVNGMLQGREMERVNGMLQGREERVNGMLQGPEERMNGMLQVPEMEPNNCSNDHRGNIFIQCILEMQNKQIAAMVKRISEQQEELQTQSLHLQALQSEVKESSLKLIVRQRHQEIALKDDTKVDAFVIESAQDCHEWFLKGKTQSGVYTIQPLHIQPFDVFCEMTVDTGWTVIQRRQDGSQNFDQSWEAYKNGFGSLSGEFWLGLENIHTLTKQEEYTLALELSDWTGETQSVQYPFRLGAEESNYTLYMPVSSPAGLESGLTTAPFSTTDRDNDLSDNVNCAKQLSGGWWFSNCGQSNLNGRYARKTHLLQRRHSRRQLIFWKTNHALRTTMLKVAPAAIKS